LFADEFGRTTVWFWSKHASHPSLEVRRCNLESSLSSASLTRTRLGKGGARKRGDRGVADLNGSEVSLGLVLGSSASYVGV